MKNLIRISGLALLLIIAGTQAFAQRGYGRMMPDSSRMANMKMHSDSLMMHGMRRSHAMGHFNFCPMCGMPMGNSGMNMHRGGGGRGMWNGQAYRMQPGFRNGFGPGMQSPMKHRIQSIPGLSDKQKKEIADLRQKQADEIRKFREESIARMKSIRDAHRKDLMNLLTDDQKKYLEGDQSSSQEK